MKERIENIQAPSQEWLLSAFAQNPHQSKTTLALQQFKQQQFDRFLERGLPTRREEAWKYNDLSFMEKNTYGWPEACPAVLDLNAKLGEILVARAKENTLVVLVNGHFAPHFSSVGHLPEGVILGSLATALQTQAALINAYLLREINLERHPFAVLNTALLSDGLFLYLPPSCRLEKPIHLLSIATGKNNFMMQPRHLFVLEREAQLTLTEEYVAEGADHYLTNAVTDIFLGRGADLNYYKLQNEAKEAKHFASVFMHQKQDSRVNAASIALGGQLARTDFELLLQEERAACRVKGFYGLDADRQVIDHHLFIDHIAANTQSEIDFRGVLAKQSRAIFNGKVRVQAAAKHTQAKQYNHNVLLSTAAEIYTKPDLEIYADEVVCRHGATIGQLDEEALFYLCARGLERSEAVVLLLQAFIDLVLDSLTLPWLAEELHELWGTRVREIV